MGKDSDQEIIIPTFNMPDLTRNLGEEDINEIEKLDRNDRRTAMAVGKLTLIANALVQHVILLTEAVRQMRKQQQQDTLLAADARRAQALVNGRVMWYESKVKVALAMVLTSILSGAGIKLLDWLTSAIRHSP